MPDFEAIIETLKDMHSQSRLRLALALDLAGVGMWDWDPRRNKLFWDKRMCALFDEPVDSVKTYETFFDKLIEEDRERVQTAVDESLVGCAPYEIDYTIRWRDGSLHLIHARGQRYPATGVAHKLIGVCMRLREDA
jgi:two-component system CheB/CheR fusion protein